MGGVQGMRPRAITVAFWRLLVQLRERDCQMGGHRQAEPLERERLGQRVGGNVSKNTFVVGQVLVVLALASGAAAAPLISASGLDGAGVGINPSQIGRVWGEAAFHSQDDLTIFAPTFGAGFTPIPELELNFVLPITHVSGEGDSKTVLGNVYVGANYLSLDGPVRATVGLGIALPTAPTDDFESVIAGSLGFYPHGAQHMELRIPGYTDVLVPLHLEMGTRVVGSLDGSFHFSIPSSDIRDDQDTKTMATIAPGFGIYLSERVIAGMRLPMWFYLPDDEDDHAQVTVEPFLRLNLGQQGFLGVRFNVPVDDPLKEADMWGLHLGGGGAF
ncbi:MAG: hypothetical protein QM784_08975 [Polyangiaceae bacterium]